MNTATPTDNRIAATELTVSMGLRIRALRLAAGMTQIDLAEAVGYRDSSSITFIEQGRNNIKLEKILRLCAVLKTSPNELFGWEEKK